MDGMLWLFLASVLAIGIVLIIVLVITQQSGKQLNRADFQARWMTIERTFDTTQPTSYQVAIFEADKLLDKALRERRFSGNTMGERMKSAKDVWKNANNIWTAHKIRNRLAHETDVKLTAPVVKRALSAYKQGLKDMGAI